MYQMAVPHQHGNIKMKESKVEKDKAKRHHAIVTDMLWNNTLLDNA
jgi:hypothetical protein